MSAADQQEGEGDPAPADLQPVVPSQVPRVLISDMDRSRVAGVVGDAFAEGRLTREEYDERLEAILSARTLNDLQPSLEGLPPAVVAQALAPLVGSLAAAAGVPAPSGSAGWYPAAGASASSSSMVAIFGGATRKGEWVVPAQMTAFAMFGGVEMDLSRATFAAETVELTAIAVFGGVEIKVPEGMTVHVDGVGIFGGFDQRAEGSGAPGSPQIMIKGAAVFGGVEVKRRPRGGEIEPRSQRR